MLAKGKFVYVVWNENTMDVNFRVSSDHGRTFSPIKTLEGNLNVANPYPQMAIAGRNDVYVMWQSNIFPPYPMILQVQMNLMTSRVTSSSPQATTMDRTLVIASA